MTYQAAVEAYIRAINERDLEAIMALYAEDATVEDPVGSGAMQGQAVRDFYAKTAAMDISAELLGSVRVTEEYALFPFRVSIRGEAPMNIEVIDSFRFNAEGKIVEMRAFWGPTNVS